MKEDGRGGMLTPESRSAPLRSEEEEEGCFARGPVPFPDVILTQCLSSLGFGVEGAVDNGDEEDEDDDGFVLATGRANGGTVRRWGKTAPLVDGMECGCMFADMITSSRVRKVLLIGVVAHEANSEPL
jgi:hypothetical protein